jgi:hypothetical protein
VVLVERWVELSSSRDYELDARTDMGEG